jgi:hypothetical protein
MHQANVAGRGALKFYCNAKAEKEEEEEEEDNHYVCSNQL